MDAMKERSALSSSFLGYKVDSISLILLVILLHPLPAFLFTLPLLKQNLWQIRWTRHHLAGKNQNPTALPIWGLPDRFYWQNWLTRRVCIISEIHKERFLFTEAVLKVHPFFSLWIHICFSDSQTWLILGISRGAFERLSWGLEICILKSHYEVVLTWV